MPATAHRHATSWEAYVAADEASEHKIELYDGEMYAMAGGTLAHGAISANVVAALNIALRHRPCVTMSSDVRVALADDGACYPDAVVVCGEAAFRTPHTLANPTVVVEVLSPSTSAWDRGGKLERYQAIPSLKYILLVAHDAWSVTLLSRQSAERWAWTTSLAGERVVLDALEVELEVDDLYRNVERVGGPARGARSTPVGA